MELTEPLTGLFVFTCEYDERYTPKEAGFRWHPSKGCRRKKCRGCEAGVASVWLTEDLVTALELVEYAADELRDSMLALAGPAQEERAEEERLETAAMKAQKMRRIRSMSASRALSSTFEVPHPDGVDYLPYQRAAIAYALERKNTLFADEMGLGKTVEALGVVNANPQTRSVLIVCPASLKINWSRECERWLVADLEVGIAGKSFPGDADVVIANYEILGKWQKELARPWDVLIADECHYVKNRDAKRSKALFAIEAARKLFLSGTPILNRPVELYSIASALEPEEFGHFWNFAKRYCSPVRNRFGWDFSGASNLVELHERLRGTIMVRRAKADVLTDLPPKRRQVIELASESFAKLIEVETRAWEEHRERLAELRALSTALGGGASEAQMEALRRGVNAAFGELAQLRQATALAKVPLIVDHLQQVIEETGKVVVFAHHRQVIRELAEPFGDAVVTLTGGDSTDARQASVDRFQTDPSCTLFVGSITAAGLGLTLTASSHVVFAELDWVPAHLTQAEDRTHRIGQKDSVLVQHLVLQDSLDARMVKTLIRKQRVVSEVSDGGGEPDLFDGQLAEELVEAATAHEREFKKGER